MPHAPAHPRLRAALALAALSLTLASAAEAQSPTLLRLRSAASADRLVVDSAGGMVAFGSYSGTIPVTGAGSRMMWYPRKSSFRAGDVTGTQWDDASIGFQSVAMGSNGTASGINSTALGSSTSATGGNSTALGGQTRASGDWSTAMGHSTVASGDRSTAMGYNAVASGNTAVSMGMFTSASGFYSTAMGAYANTNSHQGAFVYGDRSTSTYVAASAANQATWRVAGGYRIYTNAALSAGVTLAAGGSSWNTVSDRARKERFLAVDGEDVLARISTLPITTWRYTAEEDRSVRHIGPMAQDWHAAFGFSADSLTINSGDFDGVNLAAAQALATRTDALLAADVHHLERIRSLEEEIATLRARNSRLEARLDRLEGAAGIAP